MSNEEHHFLDVLYRLNWPEHERLIYCDWLDEHGREKEALAIRHHILRMLTFPERYARLATLLNRPKSA